MPSRRRADPTPDLFGSLPTPREPERPLIPGDEAAPGDPGTRPALLLPKDLAGSLERLGNAEVDALLAAVTREAKRRGRLPPGPSLGPAAEARSGPRRPAADGGVGSLTTGKLNAVRAAFRTGVSLRYRAAVRDLTSGREEGARHREIERAIRWIAAVG